MIEIQDSERPRFTVIHHGIMAGLKVSANEYLILDTVYHLSAKYGYCYKTSTSMAIDFGMTDRGVRKMIARLLERGLLTRTAAGLVCGKLWLDNAYVEQSSALSRNKVPLAGTKFLKSGTKFRQPEQSTSKNYIKELHKNNIKNTYVTLDKPKSRQAVDKTLNTKFRELVTTLGYGDRVVATPGRLSKLRLRIKQMTYPVVLQAAQGIAADGFMQGDNKASKRYGDIDYLLRSNEVVDKWANSGSENVRVTYQADW